MEENNKEALKNKSVDDILPFQEEFESEWIRERLEIIDTVYNYIKKNLDKEFQFQVQTLANGINYLKNTLDGLKATEMIEEIRECKEVEEANNRFLMEDTHDENYNS